MKSRFLGAAAAFAFVATGLAAQAQDAPRPGMDRAEPRGSQAGAKDMHRAEGSDDAAPRSQTKREEGPRARPTPRVNGVRMSSDNAMRFGERLRGEGGMARPGFDVRVGTRVPDEFALRPLPQDVAEIAPDYRDYDYFLIGDNEIVLVSPQTRRIVGTVDYEGRAAAEDMAPED